MKLQEYCAKEGLTLKQIAEALGYNYNNFAKAMRGKGTISYERAKEVSEYCNKEVTIEELKPCKTIERCSKCHQIIRKK